MWGVRVPVSRPQDEELLLLLLGLLQLTFQEPVQVQSTQITVHPK